MTELNSYVLFVAPNTCARVPTIALEEIGLPFETRLIRFMSKEHNSPDFLAINPKGRVPTLLCNGQALTENVAILRFLARQHPGAKLLPPVSSDFDDALQIADLCYCAATLHPIVTRIRIPTLFAEDASAQADLWERATMAMAAQFASVDRRLSENKWWYGADWSIMDAYLNWCWFRVTDAGFDPAPFPHLAAHAERLAERPAVQRALQREVVYQDTLKAEGLLFVPPPPPIKRPKTPQN
jgi:glutathione S-transferase